MKHMAKAQQNVSLTSTRGGHLRAVEGGLFPVRNQSWCVCGLRRRHPQSLLFLGEGGEYMCNNAVGKYDDPQILKIEGLVRHKWAPMSCATAVDACPAACATGEDVP